MVQAINAGDHDISASFFFLEDLHRLTEIADNADMLVVCRSRYDGRINRLITAFHNRKKRVLFDVDDLVFNTDYAQLILTTLDQDMSDQKVWDNWFAYSSRIGATLRICDGAITTNEYLAEQVREFSGLPVSVVPNFLNREQLEISDQLYDVKKTLKPGENGMIHFGYFSGSPSHNRDFAILIPALEELFEERTDIGLVLAGYIEAGPLLSRFGSRVKYFRFQDFINLQRLIASVEFNLIPLQNNAFTDCKSELKYFEAAIVGTQSIASPTRTYAGAIKDGINGYHSKSFSWISVLHRVLDEVGNYPAMAEAARKDARSRYAWFNQLEGIISALGLAG
jgi:glycosyltransferase involved in cell wall biosynthesis